MRGALTLHGAAHEVVIEADGRLVGDELTATSRFAVPYVAWGLTDPSVLLLSVAKEVQLEVEAAGRVTWSAGGLSDGERLGRRPRSCSSCCIG